MSDLSTSLSDPQRLRTLRQLAILDTPVEGAFDRLTRLVTTFLRVPVALVSLVDEDRQFFKSCIGLLEPWASTRQTPLSHSFCKHAVHLGAPLVIPDARDHPLVRDNLAISDLNVVAYAGIPLIASNGHVLGTLCAIDGQPREWREEDLATLTDLAASVMTELELRTALREVVQGTDRMMRLHAVTAAFSEALTPAQVADVVLSEGLPALEAKAGTVALLCNDDEELEIVADLGYERQHVQPFRRFSIDRPVPMADAVRTKEPLFFESPQVWETYYPGVDVHVASGGQAAAAVPLLTDDRVLGALGFTFADVREFPDEDRSYILTLAHQCAQALERARLYEATLDAQGQAEESREQLEFILDASTALATAPSYRAALQSLAELVVASLADICIVDIVERDGSIRRVSVVFSDQDDRSVGEQILYHFPPRFESKHPAARVIRTGRPACGALDQRLLRAMAHDEEHFSWLQGLGLTSYMCVPLIARDQPFGALSMLSCSERHVYDHSDLALAQDLARRAAAIVDAWRLFEELRAQP